MKAILSLMLIFSLSAHANTSYERDLRLTHSNLEHLQQYKTSLEEIYSGASRISKASTISKWIGFGIPATLITIATTGLGGVIFGTIGAGEYATFDKNEYKDVKKLITSDFFTPEQKAILNQHSAKMIRGDEKQRLRAEVQMLKLMIDQTKRKVAEELRKEEYDLDGGFYLSKPQRVSNYLDLQLTLTNWEIGMQSQILNKLELLQKLS